MTTETSPRSRRLALQRAVRDLVRVLPPGGASARERLGAAAPRHQAAGGDRHARVEQCAGAEADGLAEIARALAAFAALERVERAHDVGLREHAVEPGRHLQPRQRALEPLAVVLVKADPVLTVEVVLLAGDARMVHALRAILDGQEPGWEPQGH